MKQILLFSFLFPLLVQAQDSKSFEKLVEETNYYLNQYYKLSPFSEEFHAISSFSRSPKEKEDLFEFVRTEIDDDAELSANKDSISNWYMILYFQEKIKQRIKRIIKHSYLPQSNIQEMISSEMNIVVSEDKKLYNFSFAENTGGTYRSGISIMHYTEFSPKNATEMKNFQSFFESDGYNGIYTIKTEEGVKYVLTSFVRFCSLCFGTSVRLVSLNNGQFREDFKHSVESRSWEGGVSYNPQNKTIAVDYFFDDLTSYCDCNQEVETKGEWTIEESSILNYNCSYSFVFNGNNFQKVEGTLKTIIDNEKDISELLSFKIAKNKKVVKLLKYNNKTLFYAFLKPDGQVEFSFPMKIYDNNTDFKISENYDRLTFSNGNVVYQIYETQGNTSVGILVTVNNKTYDFKGDFNTLKGTLLNIQLEKLHNISKE